jgi:hypothetical protein
MNTLNALEDQVMLKNESSSMFITRVEKALEKTNKRFEMIVAGNGMSKEDKMRVHTFDDGKVNISKRNP